ncbi:hypothetical protein JCM3775_006910 [Rhodotorula graminis]
MVTETPTVVVGQVAKVAVHDVLPLLQRDSPGESFVLGGTSALALHAVGRARHGAPPHVYAYLKKVELPSQVTTSMLVRELSSERSPVVHVKLVNLHLSQTALPSFVTHAHVQRQDVSFIEWPLVLVEQLVLASTSTDPQRAVLPALMVARWCLAIGRHDVALSHDGRMTETLRWPSVSGAVEAALGTLLFVSELDALAAFWLERLNDGLAVRVAQYEWMWNELVQAEIDVNNLAGWYVEIFRRLQLILERVEHPTQTRRRSSFVPVARFEQ